MGEETNLGYKKKINYFLCILIFISFPISLYFILSFVYKANLKEFGTKDGWLGFLGGYCGVGGALLIGFISLNKQEKQFKEQLKLQKEQFEEEKKLLKRKDLKRKLKAYKSINIILNTLLIGREKEISTPEFRFLYSFLFIATPTVYNKNHFFLSSKLLKFLEENLFNIDSSIISENMIEIISLIDEIEEAGKDIIKNSYSTFLEFIECYYQISNTTQLDFKIVNHYKKINEELRSEKEVINFIKNEMDEILFFLTTPPNILNLEKEFFVKDIKSKEAIMQIINKMNNLVFVFALSRERELKFFVNCINVVNLMMSMVHMPGEEKFYKTISKTFTLIKIEIEEVEKELSY